MNKLANKKKILLSAISVSAVLIFAVTMLILYFTIGHNLHGNNSPPPIDYSLFNKNAVLTQSQVEQDKRELVETVEKTHPYFVIKEIHGYEAAKQKFLASDIKTAGDFYFEAAEYLAIFNDLHTAAVAIFYESLRFNIPAYVENDKWMLYPYGENGGAFELIAVNGVPIKQIISAYLPQENDNSIVAGFSRIFMPDFLSRADIEWENSLTFTYKNTDGGLFDVVHSIVGYNSTGSGLAQKNFEAKIVSGDILYIYARAMQDDGSYPACIDFIKSAVKSGIKKVIFDVRGNSGGSDSYGRGILDALGFDYSDMGFTVRYSDATANYKGTWRKTGYKNIQQFKYRSKNKNNIDLRVFCDERTASAAMLIVNQCRYSDLGKIIGRMPMQNSNFCGNGIMFQLTHSKVVFTLPLSYSYFERDGQRAPDQIIVDVVVPALEDYMDYTQWLNP